jgi:alkylhydroperoxidase family enzyme
LLRYKVSTRNTCLYCSTHQIRHLRLQGVEQEKIDNVHAFETHPAFNERERAALAFVDAMAEDATNIPDPVFERFAATFPPQERAEIAIIAAAMGMLNVLNDAFRLPIDKDDVDTAMSVPEFGKK